MVKLGLLSEVGGVGGITVVGIGLANLGNEAAPLVVIIFPAATEIQLDGFTSVNLIQLFLEDCQSVLFYQEQAGPQLCKTPVDLKGVVRGNQC